MSTLTVRELDVKKMPGKDVMDYAIKSRGDTKQFGDLLSGLPSATSKEARGQSQQKLHELLNSFLNATESQIKEAGEVHVGLSTVC
jgi:hypothetical protein